MRAAGHTPGNQWTTEGLWTPEEDDVIRYHIRDRPRASWIEIAPMLGRTRGACATRATRLKRVS